MLKSINTTAIAVFFSVPFDCHVDRSMDSYYDSESTYLLAVLEGCSLRQHLPLVVGSVVRDHQVLKNESYVRAVAVVVAEVAADVTMDCNAGDRRIALGCWCDLDCAHLDVHADTEQIDRRSVAGFAGSHRILGFVDNIAEPVASPAVAAHKEDFDGLKVLQTNFDSGDLDDSMNCPSLPHHCVYSPEEAVAEEVHHEIVSELVPWNPTSLFLLGTFHVLYHSAVPSLVHIDLCSYSQNQIDDFVHPGRHRNHQDSQLSHQNDSILADEAFGLLALIERGAEPSLQQVKYFCGKVSVVR